MKEEGNRGRVVVGGRDEEEVASVGTSFTARSVLDFRHSGTWLRL